MDVQLYFCLKLGAKVQLLIFNLVDEAYYNETTLLFIKDKKELKVYLEDIVEVSYISYSNPARVKVKLKTTTEFGKVISFIPIISYIPFKKSPEIKEMFNKIENKE